MHLTTVWVANLGFEIVAVGSDTAISSHWTRPPGPLEDGAQLARWRFDGKVQVRGRLAIDVGFDDSSLPALRGRPVVETLLEFSTWMGSIMDDFRPLFATGQAIDKAGPR